MTKESRFGRHPIPQYPSWVEAVKGQRAVVDLTINAINRRMSRMMSQSPNSTPDLDIAKGRLQIVAAKHTFPFIQVRLTSTSEEIASAPQALQMLFKDMNVDPTVSLEIQAWYRETPDKTPRDEGYVNPASAFKFVPKEYDPERLGIEVETFLFSAWSIIESGMRLDWSMAPKVHTERAEKLRQALELIRQGQVRRLYDIGTHTATTGYEHMPTVEWAHILQASAEWSLGMINTRLSASGQPEIK